MNGEPIILRPAKLTRQEVQILKIVWQRYREGGPLTFRTVSSALGLTAGGIRVSTHGEYGQSGNQQGLTKTGWLDSSVNGALRPGPRFGGYNRKKGEILEVVQAARMYA